MVERQPPEREVGGSILTQVSVVSFSKIHLPPKKVLVFLAHLSRRLRGELIVYQSSRRPSVRACVRLCVHTFKHEYL